ncbi:hypothetical protein TNIN_423231 [Trichonephila inaurata madagascariensis]|uniref:Bap31/Bap29 cytoplasmic coiled-coil domain-containing protein n=1 Tax=Trichonephila inaurata madagascariensis TaxID=2747483 RepID=A0A8X7C6T2_9ARAC|nr:hypothetical protein TNIN_423231 [Trichonephila inaurata madagascariensis]
MLPFISATIFYQADAEVFYCKRPRTRSWPFRCRTPKKAKKKKETRLVKTQKDLETLRSQAEGTNREYDRLLKEHEKLQKELEKGSGDSEKKNE